MPHDLMALAIIVSPLVVLGVAACILASKEKGDNG